MNGGQTVMTEAKVVKRELNVLWILSARILLPIFWNSCEITAHKTVTVATYNIWNVMFQWDVRKYHIAEMIHKFQPDVVGFQEVRGDITDKRSQLLELQLLLPQYKHYVYHTATRIFPPLGLRGPPGWQYEGLGMLSRHPIIKSHVFNLTLESSGSTDSNNRILLHTQLDIGDEDKLDVILVHLSYDRKQQCRNVLDIINFISAVGSKHSVIMGDFNVYNDFDSPVKAILKGSFTQGDSKCHLLVPQDTSVGYRFVDAWDSVNHNTHNLGYTFSNMPEPGLVSRPDRILVSKRGIRVESAQLVGDGSEYKQRYSFWNKWSRLETVIAMAKAASTKLQSDSFSYPCYQDCGPHGSCRCGVCVAGSDNNCNLFSCSECDKSHYSTYLAVTLVVVIYTLFLFYILAKVILRCYILGDRRSARRIVFLFPNRFLMVFLVSAALSLLVFVIHAFGDSLETVNNRLAEEMFPSDHLMLLAKLKLIYR